MAANDPSLKTDLLSLGRKSSAYVIGHLATRAISFLLLPLYTNALTPADYGILTMAFTFSAISLIVFHFGIDSALLQFFTGAGRSRQKEVFSTVFLTQLAAILILVIPLLLFREQMAPFVLGAARPDWLALLAGIIVADTLWAHPMHVRRAEGRAVSYASLSLINALVTMGGNIIMVGMLGMGITGALLSNLIASSLLFAINLPVVISYLRIPLWERKTLGQLLKFGLPFLPAGLLTMTMELADRYLLRWLADLSTVGIYSAGYKLGLVMLLLVTGFHLGWQPFFLRRGREPDPEPVFARVATYLAAGLAWVLLTVSAWIDPLIRLQIGSLHIFGPAYWPGASIVPLILLAYWFYGLYVVQMPGIHLTQKTGWIILFRGTGAAANVGLNLILIPRMGDMGAALANAIAFMLMAAVAFLVLRRIYPVPYEWGRLARIGGLVALGMVLVFTWTPGLTRNVLLTLLVPVGLWATGGVREEERRYLRRLLMRA